MKALGCFLVLAVLTANAAGAQTFPINHPPGHPIVPSRRLQVLATVEPASAKPGAPIIVKLILKNVFYKDVKVSDISSEVDYELEVVDRAGKELTRTAFGDRLYWGKYVLLHTDGYELDLFQEVRSEIDVTKIFQLT